MATTVTAQNFGTANVIIATENAANISIAINYTPFLANIANAVSAIAANIAFIASNVAAINANTVNNASSSDSTLGYWSSLITQVTTIATQTTTMATKVSSIEDMANGDHGIHFRQPHQWAGGSATFTSESAAEGDTPQATTVTISNVSE
jgi:hypothetical protein